MLSHALRPECNGFAICAGGVFLDPDPLDCPFQFICLGVRSSEASCSLLANVNLL